MIEPAGEIREAACNRCGKGFYYDAHLWQHPQAPSLCALHRAGHHSRWSPSRRNEGRHKKIRNLFGWRHGNTSPVTPQLLRIREQPFAIEPVLDTLCEAIASEPARAHIIFGRRYSGKSTILPLGLIDTPEITDRGQIVIVEPLHEKVLKYASTLGQTYYDVYDPIHDRPDLSGALCGPYLAVGYRTGVEDASSELNLVWYSTRGTFHRSLSNNKLRNCSCLVLSQPQQEKDEVEFVRLLDKTLQYRKDTGGITLIIGSETDDEEELIMMLGGAQQVMVHRIPPLVSKQAR